MSRKPGLAYLLGCATLPMVVILVSLLAAGWMYFTVPVEAGPGHDGLSLSTALIVEAETEFEAVNAENIWLATRRPSDTYLSQSLVLEGDRVYDVFEMQTSDDGTYDLYFDITHAYGHW
jgi:hypothetical protein